ncbi:kinase-like protein [Penicillium capsulatum]|uniref:Kinase-like protein n=1 Tax=Penicillium capsulatum TaxID=69766 RepID=A0A9W9HNP3_9EURO|nr:kinase-like protein [Penicillium capsulatum]KAJ6113006.1 kinase-like protein [Penicillium capsulatum]
MTEFSLLIAYQRPGLLLQSSSFMNGSHFSLAGHCLILTPSLLNYFALSCLMTVLSSLPRVIFIVVTLLSRHLGYISGCFPEYWEARKAQCTVDSEEWSTEYLPMILDQYTRTADPWDWYTSSLGC